MSAENNTADASKAAEGTSAGNATETTTTIEESLSLAKRAYALKKYERAVEHYATALELSTAKHGEDAPQLADLYYAYGKALLENAISQNSVLGNQQAAEEVLPAEPGSSGAFLSFSGDPEDEEGEDTVMNLKEQEDEEEDGDEGEPEDDFNAAWEVLELARSLFEKQQEESDEIKLKLAETYIALGDVSLETEKFDQAITDYEQALTLKTTLLPQSSRQLAEAHYKLSIVLDLSSGRLQDAIEHAEKALESVEARLAELRNGLSGQMKVEAIPDPSDTKGKGKAKGPRLLGEDAVQNMNQSQMESELKELEGLREDLAAKVEELKTIPNEPKESAPELAAKALDAELNAGPSSSSASAPTQVNDLTSIVKKKKKAPAPEPETNGAASISSGKRKAEDDGSESPSEKKAKLESEAQS
ncbi:hypothetical protein K474DRAFT_1669694 [Panus rudis PR-1116 ss-1]|nr:hypothetical protein K474DRAFT_1669694 [Panus rudis PR-1116 ss-1]